ncbi:MAG: T9SS type A sorting domain-containing protein [Bacteroidota bacterium]
MILLWGSLLPGLGLAQPVVNLGGDTVVCGSLVLDAQNAGATYAWNTAATSQTITVSTSGLYWVDVTDGTGTTRDSIQVFVDTVPSGFVFPDTTLCGPQTVDLNAPSGADILFWYNQPTDTLPYLAAKNQTNVSLSNTSSFYYRGVNLTENLEAGLKDTVGQTILMSTFGQKGFFLDVHEPFLLKTVDVYTDQPLNIRIFIYDPSGAIIYDQVKSAPNTGKNTLSIDHIFYPGQNYWVRPAYAPGSFGLLARAKPFPFPIENYGIFTMTDESDLDSDQIRSYPFLYNWIIDAYHCQADLDSFQVNVLLGGVTDLPDDSIACGDSLILDVTFPGASYLWSTGATTGAATIDSFQTVSVDITQGNCTITDSTLVGLVPDPDLSFPDTTLCGSQSIDLFSPGGAQTIFWYDDPQASRPSFVGNSREDIYVGDTTVFYYQAGNAFNGLETALKDTSDLPYIFSDLGQKGVFMDVQETFRLNSFEVYANQTMKIRVRIYDPQGVLEYDEIKDVPQAGLNTIDIDHIFYPGNNYWIRMGNVGGFFGLLLRIKPFTFPVTYDGLFTMTGESDVDSDQKTSYPFFYNWNVDFYKCLAPVDSFQVNITLPYDLPADIYSCTDTVIPGSVPTATYLWSDGSTNPTLLVSETDTISVTISDGLGCVVTDTTFVEIPQDAGLAPDGVLCGRILFTNYGSESTFLWSDNSTDPTLTINNPGTYSVVVSEPQGCMLYDTIMVTGIDSFPEVELGPDISICDSIVLDAGNPGLNFIWNTGATTQAIQVKSSGIYRVSVSNANNCTTVDSIGVLVNMSPMADFFVPDTVISPNLAVNFSNLSSFGNYSWALGDGQFSSSISPTHVYGDTGTYCVQLVVTDLNGCGMDTTEKCFFLQRYPTSVEDPWLAANLKIYPNPTRGTLHLELTDRPEALQLSLFNLSGQIVRESSYLRGGSLKESWDLSQYPAGLLILRARMGERSLSRLIHLQ